MHVHPREHSFPDEDTGPVAVLAVVAPVLPPQSVHSAGDSDKTPLERAKTTIEPDEEADKLVALQLRSFLFALSQCNENLMII